MKIPQADASPLLTDRVRLDAQAVWRDELARVKFPSPFLFVLSACGIEECSVCRCR
ncbi:hypothetical protein COLO4_23643 [Corchorus olitorius]|uniref:Uncharacterized protein n=1 Tax=Corchorus olitorius TaxID=93759 RepID=A0A1R3IFI8_9ROSI|nr:hypothetical protein COLO4_23643 [Corchorus olitorius]